MLIAKITESDFFGGEPQYIDDDARYNTRGVMTDGEGNIAMMKIEDSEYYKLPGGSIEITETPDKAFLREVTEETSLKIKNLKYFGSQPWPYPCGLMIGFYAEYESGEIKLQRSELGAGGWFTMDNLPPIPEKLSIARKLIDNWIENHDKI